VPSSRKWTTHFSSGSSQSPTRSTGASGVAFVATGEGEDELVVSEEVVGSPVLPLYVPQPASVASTEAIAAVAMLIRVFTALPMSTVTL
jgi:hypothetical protein